MLGKPYALVVDGCQSEDRATAGSFMLEWARVVSQKTGQRL